MAIGMTAHLYKYSGDPRLVDKTSSLRNDTTLTLYLNTQCDVINPVFSINYNKDWTQYNYAYIPDWGRYYFITDYKSDGGQKLYLTLGIDVLNTYKTAIKGCDATVIRQENAGINYVIDDKLPIYPDLCDINIEELSGGNPWTTGNIWNFLLGVI